MIKTEETSPFLDWPNRKIQNFIPGYYELSQSEKYRASILIGSCAMLALALLCLILLLVVIVALIILRRQRRSDNGRDYEEGVQ